MGQRTNLLLQVEGRSGARLNRVYHLQWGYRKYLPMAFLLLLSSRYFKPEKTDIFEFFTRGLDLDSLDMIERDWNKYDFNNLDECQEALSHCDNNNGAMVVVITEDARDYYHPKYKLGFLLSTLSYFCSEKHDQGVYNPYTPHLSHNLHLQVLVSFYQILGKPHNLYQHTIPTWDGD